MKKYTRTNFSKLEVQAKFLNKVVGNLVLLKFLPRSRSKENTKVLVRCLCGKEFEVPITRFNAKKVTSCGNDSCKTYKIGKGFQNPLFEDLTGKRFGSLVVLHLSDYKGNRIRWRCVCDCGNSHDAYAKLLKNGISKRCKNRIHRISKNSGSWRGFGDIPKKLWSRIQRSAKIRNLSITVSIEDIWSLYLKQGGKCALSGIPIKFELDAKTAGTASLDRIDSTRGYELDNIQWVHKTVNLIKMGLSQSEFITMCKNVANYRG